MLSLTALDRKNQSSGIRFILAWTFCEEVTDIFPLNLHITSHSPFPKQKYLTRREKTGYM